MNATTTTGQSTRANGAPPPMSGLAIFVRLASPYWRGDTARQAWTLTIASIAFAVAQVGIQLGLNGWIGWFFDLLDDHDRGLGWAVVVFIALSALMMAVAAQQIYLRMALQVRWRAWVTLRLIDRWLARSRHYLLPYFDGESDNPDYRIAEDVRLVTEAAVDFAMAIVNGVLLLAGFVSVLWSLSGAMPVNLLGVRFALPGYLVWAAIVYALAGSALTWWFGNPMIKINEERHAREGDFRFHLVRTRERSETIALQGGEATEVALHRGVLDALIAAWQRLMAAQRRLTLITTGYSSAAPIVPLLVAAPEYLAGGMTLGNLVQAGAAFVQVQLALGFFVDNFARLSDWRAALNRIGTLDQGLARIEQQVADGSDTNIAIGPSADGCLRLIDLHLDSPDGAVVIDQASVTVKPGEKVLVTGEAGAGSTTLFRAIAALWPWGKGRIELPAQATRMFVPQRPYIPHGTLRNALIYPQAADRFADADLAEALMRCGLAPLVLRLPETAQWDQVLSESEQQKFSFARLLIHRPDWAFLDQATSALTEQEQESMMSLFRGELGSTSLISAGFRSGLSPFHDQTLTLVKSRGGTRLERPRIVPRGQRPAWN